MYSDYENSLDSGSPIELYSFTRGVKKWGYTSGASDVLLYGQTFHALALKRDSVKQTNNIFKDSLQLTFPRGNEFAMQYLGFAPENMTTVSILRGHYGDADKDFKIYWKGRIVGAKVTGNSIGIDCESIFTTMKRPGLRARFEYSCRHALYQPNCGVNKEIYKYEGSVNLLTGGLTISVSGASQKVDGYYTGGIIVSENNAGRFLTNHVGDDVTLSRPLVNLSVGDVVTLYPGCDHLKGTCAQKFSNLNNFGGFPFIPKRNPFDGSSIL